MRRKLWFTLAVVLQIIVLVVMIGMKWSTLAYGTKILLKTKPVDPWDLFRGDYVVLNYDLSDLNLKTIPADISDFKNNETVYVVLKQQGRYWVADSVSHTRPSGGTLAIKGVVIYYNSGDKVLNLQYGIESYFVPQDQGRTIEKERSSLEAEVSVDSSGNSALVGLFIQGKEVKFQ
ncbi:MAG: GDYXXLXY domain-containing protein [Eubacteriales bacterium]